MNFHLTGAGGFFGAMASETFSMKKARDRVAIDAGIATLCFTRRNSFRLDLQSPPIQTVPRGRLLAAFD